MTEPAPEQATDPRTETGRAKAAVIEAIRADFERADALMTELVELAHHSREESAGLNGLSTYWRGVVQKLESDRDSMRKECEETVDKLLGRKKTAPEITESVDQTAADQVKVAKGAA